MWLLGRTSTTEAPFPLHMFLPPKDNDRQISKPGYSGRARRKPIPSSRDGKNIPTQDCTAAAVKSPAAARLPQSSSGRAPALPQGLAEKQLQGGLFTYFTTNNIDLGEGSKDVLFSGFPPAVSTMQRKYFGAECCRLSYCSVLGLGMGGNLLISINYLTKHSNCKQRMK